MQKIIKRAAKFLFFKIVYPLYYLWCSRKPVRNDKVVFGELMSSELTASFMLLYRELDEHYRFDIEVLLLNQLRMPYRKKVALNFSVIKQVADARYVFIDNTFPVISACPVRDETIVIQTWHGCGAFKKFGYSLVKGGGESSGWDYKMYPLHAHYDYVFVSGREAIAPYADAFGMENETEKILPLGVSRTDVYFDEEFIREAKESIADRIPQSRSKRVILYAPTYRGTVSHAHVPCDLDIEALRRKLGEEYVLLINYHPFSKNRIEIPDSCKEFAFEVNERIAIDRLLCVSDICITDYSSVVFEYSLFNRQILFYVPDLDEYTGKRGFYYDFEDFACGPICRTTDEVLACAGEFSTDDSLKIRDFRDRFMNGCDGGATKRILHTVFGDELENHRLQEVLECV